MLEQIKARFAGKMTSVEEYQAAANQTWIDLGFTSRTWLSKLYPHLKDRFNLPGLPIAFHDVSFNNKYYADSDAVCSTTWWWHREAARQVLGIYPTMTDTLAAVVRQLQLEPYAVHMSVDPETPTAVCYTPDNAMGQADRQIKLSSLSKLVTKLFPLASEEYKQAVDAAHKAELDPSFGMATTKDDILRVYRNVDGDTGCMRYPGSQWDLPEGYHPSNVYEASGVGIAYHEVNGTIKARALTWENPVTGKKQYVRLYGDRVLERKLVRAGYEYGSMAGAKIKAVRMPEERYGSDRYVVPYIDGGMGNADLEGTYGYIDKRDPDHIQLVGQLERNRLVSAGIEVHSFRDHRNVVHEMYPQDLSVLEFVCPLTGIAVRRGFEDVAVVWYHGRKIDVLMTADVRRRFPHVLHRLHEGRLVSMRHTVETPFFYHHGNIVDDEAHRLHCGFVKLSEKFYGPSHWVNHSTTTTVSGHNIHRVDSVVMIDAEGGSHVHHKTEVSTAALRKAGYYRVKTTPHVCAEYLHKDNPAMVVLDSGARAHKVLSAVVELFDGTWTHKRNAITTRFYGATVNVRKDERFMVSAADAPRALKLVLGEMYDFNQYCELALLRSGMDVEVAVGFVQGKLNNDRVLRCLRGGAGNMPVFYDGEFSYMGHSPGLFNFADVGAYVTRMKAIPEDMLDGLTQAERGHIALAIAVQSELVSLYDTENLRNLVNAAALRMAQDAAPVSNDHVFMEAA